MGCSPTAVACVGHEPFAVGKMESLYVRTYGSGDALFFCEGHSQHMRRAASHLTKKQPFSYNMLHMMSKMLLYVGVVLKAFLIFPG